MAKDIFKTSIPAALNLLLIVLALLVIFSFGIRTMSGGEIWTHLSNGRAMSEQGGVPKADQFSFTRENTELVDSSWLYDKVVYAVWQMAGIEGVTLVHAVSVLLAFLVLIPLARHWAGYPAIALSLLLCGWLISFRFDAAPSVFTLVFPAVMMTILYSMRVRPVFLWTLIPLVQWLWTNMYGSFVLGPILILMMGLQAFFRRDDARPKYSHQTWFGLAGLSLLVTLLNPYGPGLYRHVFSLWGSPSLISAGDWISPFATQFSSSLPSILIVVTLVVGAVGLVTYREKLPMMLTMIVALAAFLSVRSLRFIDILSVLAFPFLCLATQAMLGSISGVAKNIRGDRPILEYAASILVLLAAFLSLASITTQDYYSRSGSDSRFGLGVEKSAAPAAAAQVMARPDFPQRALNLPGDGGYLSWSLPERKVFIDDRRTLFGGELYAALNRAVLGDDEAWADIVDSNQIDAVIVPCSIYNGGIIFRNVNSKPEWKLVYFDGLSGIFVRRRNAYAAILNDEELRSSGLELLKDARRSYASELEQARRMPNSARLIGAGNVFYASAKMRAAAEIFDLLVRGSPNMTGGWVVSGIARARGGFEYGRAVEMLERACELNPNTALSWMWMSFCYNKLGDLNESMSAYERGLELDPDLSARFKRPATGL